MLVGTYSIQFCNLTELTTNRSSHSPGSQSFLVVSPTAKCPIVVSCFNVHSNPVLILQYMNIFGELHCTYMCIHVGQFVDIPTCRIVAKKIVCQLWFSLSGFDQTKGRLAIFRERLGMKLSSPIVCNALTVGLPNCTFMCKRWQTQYA